MGGRVASAVGKSILFRNPGMQPNCYVAVTYAMSFLPESLMGMANRLSVTFFLADTSQASPTTGKQHLVSTYPTCRWREASSSSLWAFHTLWTTRTLGRRWPAGPTWCGNWRESLRSLQLSTFFLLRKCMWRRSRAPVSVSLNHLDDWNKIHLDKLHNLTVEP